MTQNTTQSAPADRPSRTPWPAILFPGAILGPLLLGVLFPLPWPGLNDLPAQAIGYAFGLGGVALVVWAITQLVRARTAVRPDRGATALVTSGPFRHGRNPIYAGEVLILLGMAQLTLNVWFVIFAALFGILVYRLAIVREERYLEARFGDEYRAYKARTRRWI